MMIHRSLCITFIDEDITVQFNKSNYNKKKEKTNKTIKNERKQEGYNGNDEIKQNQIHRFR